MRESRPRAAVNDPATARFDRSGNVNPVISAARNRGRGPLAQGIFTMVVFGLGWALVAAVGLTSSGPGRIAAGAVAVVLAVLVAVLALRSRASPSARRGRSSADPGRDFVRVNIAQTVLILVAVFGFARAGHPLLIAPATALVVGLHFLPLARIFGIPLYLVTGAVLVLIAGIGFVLVTTDVSDSAVLVAVGLPAAVTLWCTSLLLPRYG